MKSQPIFGVTTLPGPNATDLSWLALEDVSAMSDSCACQVPTVRPEWGTQPSTKGGFPWDFHGNWRINKWWIFMDLIWFHETWTFVCFYESTIGILTINTFGIADQTGAFFCWTMNETRALDWVIKISSPQSCPNFFSIRMLPSFIPWNDLPKVKDEINMLWTSWGESWYHFWGTRDWTQDWLVSSSLSAYRWSSPISQQYRDHQLLTQMQGIIHDQPWYQHSQQQARYSFHHPYINTEVSTAKLLWVWSVAWDPRWSSAMAARECIA